MDAAQIAAMIADREAGTPGPWFVAGVRVNMDRQQWHAISRYDDAAKRDENICCAGYDPKTGLGFVDARRIARVPDMEATIIARDAELERLRAALTMLLPQNLGPLPERAPDSGIIPVDMTFGEIRQARAALKGGTL